MQLYLSSHRLGGRTDELIGMTRGRTLGFVPNALDHLADEESAQGHDIALGEVRDVGISTEMLDLRSYFGRADALRQRLQALGGVWVRGGNVFALRQAMRLSGFDRIVPDQVEPDFLYAGYSAGVCVLGPSLDGLQHVDDPDVKPYPGSETVWEGLGVLDELILPHFESDHPESEGIDREVAYCQAKGIPFRTLRDGEVLVFGPDGSERA